eukprot:Polyplicarium_translucidae@DN3116_c0_g2_i5.p1
MCPSPQSLMKRIAVDDTMSFPAVSLAAMQQGIQILGDSCPNPSALGISDATFGTACHLQTPSPPHNVVSQDTMSQMPQVSQITSPRRLVGESQVVEEIEEDFGDTGELAMTDSQAVLHGLHKSRSSDSSPIAAQRHPAMVLTSPEKQLLPRRETRLTQVLEESEEHESSPADSDSIDVHIDGPISKPQYAVAYAEDILMATSSGVCCDAEEEQPDAKELRRERRALRDGSTAWRGGSLRRSSRLAADCAVKEGVSPMGVGRVRKRARRGRPPVTANEPIRMAREVITVDAFLSGDDAAAPPQRRSVGAAADDCTARMIDALVPLDAPADRVPPRCYRERWPSNWHEQNEMASEDPRMRRASTPPVKSPHALMKTRPRKPAERWSDEEVLELIEGINAFEGKHWSLISKAGFASKRDQVALKDKWRNLVISASVGCRNGVFYLRGATDPLHEIWPETKKN